MTKEKPVGYREFQQALPKTGLRNVKEAVEGIRVFDTAAGGDPAKMETMLIEQRHAHLYNSCHGASRVQIGESRRTLQLYELGARVAKLPENCLVKLRGMARIRL